MAEKLRAALIGCGRMGATIDDEVPGDLPYSHAAGYMAADGVDLIAAVDVRPTNLQATLDRYEIPNGYAEYQDMIQQEKPDIISIATRPAPHAAMTIYAAQNGVKGIYCEKPLCCSMAEADAMLEAVEAHGVKFNYGTNRRYQTLYQVMREHIEQGAIGNLECVICHCGVGAAQWSHTHMADMMLFLAGDAEIEYVQSTTNAQESDWEGNRLNTDPGIPMGYVRFKNGVLGYQVVSSGYEFEVSGSGGKLRALSNGLGLQIRVGSEPPRLIEGIAREMGTVACIEDLVEAIHTGRETRGNIQLACRSQEMILGFIESDRQGGCRVPLPLTDREMLVSRRDW